jgi:hypothetical protein
MSTSDNVLTVEAADAAAEISVFDGSLNNVAKSVGQLRKELPRGIYKVRIRVGPSFQDQLVSLDKDREIKVESLAFASPIPLTGTSRSHEYHQAAAVDASRIPRATFGRGASILVFAREWSGDGPSLSSNPAAGLILCSEAGETLAVISDTADVRTVGDASAGWRADVAPGAYRLRLKFSDGSSLERSLFATSGKQTQIFFLQRDHVLRDGNVERRADLTAATITISPNQSFDPQDRRARLSELACYALTQSRRILSDAVLRDILDEKFEDPMLGLLGAHLILHDYLKDLSAKPTASRQFNIVTDNLRRLLGPSHPDLQALWWQRGDGSSIGDDRLHALPMLRRSWDLAVERSFQDAGAISLQSPCSAAIARILSTAPWLVWRVEDNETASAETGALSDAVGEYLRARARAAAVRASQPPSPAGRPAAINAKPAGRIKPASRKKSALKKSDSKKSSTRSSQLPAPVETSVQKPLESAVSDLATPAAVALDYSEKVDIARTLGVSSQMLEAMLQKFSA